MATVNDLLRHYPRRYAKLGELSDLSELDVGQYATVMAKVADVKNYAYTDRNTRRRKTRTEVTITDGTGRLTVTFFQQKWRENQMKPATVRLFAGTVGAFRGSLQLTHPLFEPIDDDEGPSGNSRLARGIIPIYPATSVVTSFTLEKAVGTVLDIIDAGADQ